MHAFRNVVSPTTATMTPGGQQQNISMLRRPAMHRVQGSSAVNRMNANFSTNLASKQGSSPHSENVPATVPQLRRPRRSRSSRSNKSSRRTAASSLRTQSGSGRWSSVISRQ